MEETHYLHMISSIMLKQALKISIHGMLIISCVPKKYSNHFSMRRKSIEYVRSSSIISYGIHSHFKTFKTHLMM